MAFCPVHTHATARPHALALQTPDLQLTWLQLDQRVQQMHTWLRQAGVRGGDRVAWLSANQPDVWVLHLALARLGAAAVPLNHRLTAPELAALVVRGQPSLVLASAGFAHLCACSPFPDLSAGPAVWVGEPVAVDDHAVHAVLFTSGTTGTPRGALLPLEAFFASARASALRLGGQPQDHWLCTLPLFHVGGLAMAWRCAVYGALLTLHSRFDAAQTWNAVLHQGVTHLSLVGTTLARLVDHAHTQGGKPAHNVTVLVGGGPVAASLLHQARALGLLTAHTYGLTEACSQVCTQQPGTDDAAHCGPPLDGVTVAVVTEEGAPCPPGTVGQVWVQSPSVMRGYLDDEASSAAALVNGWLHTGDLGTLDAQGHLTVLARRTDLIVRGGENIYPAELEQALQTCPGVRECAVVAIPDPQWGQVPLAAVVLEPHTLLNAVQRFSAEHLARFKQPARWLVLPALPRNAMAKVDRRALALLLDKPSAPC